MERLIRFSSMVHGLSSDEFDKMLLNTHRVLGRSIFVKALFLYFSQQNEVNEYWMNMEHVDEINKINIILADIIYNRGTDKIDSHRSPPCKKARYKRSVPEISTCLPRSICTINNLPSSLIAATASYLNLSEYNKFERVNRFIFTSCRTDGYSLPIKAIGYNDSILSNKTSNKNEYIFWIQRYYKQCQLYGRKMNLQRFDKLQQIALDLAYLPILDYNVSASDTTTTALWNNAETLKLYSFHDWIQRADIHSFVQSNYCNFSTVKKLILSDFGCKCSDDIQAYTSSFLSLLCHGQFLHVQQLELLSVSNVCLDLSVMDEPLFDCVYPNLRALHYEADSIIGRLMVHLYGSQLQSLHINDNVTSSEWFCTCLHRNQYSGQCAECGTQCLNLLNLRQIRFDRLTELCLYNQSDDIMFQCITKSALHLRKLHVSFRAKSVHTYNAIKTILHSVIVQQSEIEYISIETDSLTPIVEVLQNAVTTATNGGAVFERLKLKIIIVEEVYERELKSSLVAIKRSLHDVVKRNWMVLLRAEVETKNRIDDHIKIQQCTQHVKYGEDYDEFDDVDVVPEDDCLVSCHVEWRHQYHTVSMVVSNKHCMMNGYKEHWLLECKECTTQDFIPYDNVH